MKNMIKKLEPYLWAIGIALAITIWIEVWL